jgi:amidohydrolase
VKTIPDIEAYRSDLVRWRRAIHAHPELAYEETRTADFVADRLTDWGLTIDRGLGKTGVVGTLACGSGRTVGLRADMDALPLEERNEFEHRSALPGKMHACGHDGHTTMLLGAARYLAAHRDFAGTIHFIFQPAEEAAGGAKAMLDEGLFERFPVDAVFGMHNWPGIEVGRFALRPGPMMASIDCFDATIEGRGTHGALPHHGVDAVLAAARVIESVQSIVSRNVDPLEPAVVSVTKIHAGQAHNVIPDRVALGGAIRCFEPALRDYLRRRLEEVVVSTAAAAGATARLDYGFANPAVLNEPRATALAARVAGELVGDDRVDAQARPVLGSEDFAFMLERRPGCYLLIGNGTEDRGGCMIHNPRYDFNDEILTLGASYWVRLAQAFLAA